MSIPTGKLISAAYKIGKQFSLVRTMMTSKYLRSSEENSTSPASVVVRTVTNPRSPAQGTTPTTQDDATPTAPGQGQDEGASTAEAEEIPRMNNVKDPPENIFKSPLPNPLGPGAEREGQYKVPEYYSFNRESYYEMEVVMQELRTPQPVAIESGPGPKIGDNF